MSADEAMRREANGGVREISIQELVGEPREGFKRHKVRNRERIRDDDPYFRVIDAGHDLLMTKKKYREAADCLPAALQSMLLELEGILKEITLAAMEDAFDYRTQVDRYYFFMLQINYLSSLVAFRIQHFVVSSGSMPQLLGALGNKERCEEVMRELRELAGIGDELKLSSNIFMDHLELDDSIEPKYLEKRKLVLPQNTHPIPLRITKN